MSVLERCPSYKESNKGNKQRQGPTLDRCPFYRGVRLIGVFVKRKSTVLQISPLEETTIFILLFFCLLQMSIQEKFLLVLILVSEWTVGGK